VQSATVIAQGALLIPEDQGTHHTFSLVALITLDFMFWAHN